MGYNSIFVWGVVKGLLCWGKSNLRWRGRILQPAEIASYFLQPFYMYVISWCIKLFMFVFLLILQALILTDKLTVPSSVSDLNRVRLYWPLLRLKELCHYWIFVIVELLCAKHASGAPWVRKWSNLPIWENLVIRWRYTDRLPLPSDRPSAPQAYQCKITPSTGMETQMQLEVILAGNRQPPASCKAETKKESIKYPYCLKYLG